MREFALFCLSGTCWKAHASPFCRLGQEAFFISAPNTKYLALGDWRQGREGGWRGAGLRVGVLPPTTGGRGTEKTRHNINISYYGETKVTMESVMLVI